MKRLLFYFSIVLLTITTGACSKDDNTPDDTVKKDLMIEVSNATVDVGALVVFKALDNDRKEVKDVDFYVDDVKVTKEYKFEQRGVYNVIAKKAGYRSSAPFAILVGGTIAEKLNLTVSSTDIFLGEKITFTVSADGRSVTDYHIDNIGNGMFSGNSWIPLEVGSYTFYAFKEGFFNSDKITINVKPKEIKDNQYFIIKEIKYAIDDVELSVQVQERKDETDEAIPFTRIDEKTGRKYQTYELLVRNEDSDNGIVYWIGVYVSNDEKTFVLPELADKADVFSISVSGVVKGKTVVNVDANAIDKASVEWLGANDDTKEEQGPIKYELLLKDKSVVLKYEGTYIGVFLSDIKDSKTQVKGVNKLRFR